MPTGPGSYNLNERGLENRYLASGQATLDQGLGAIRSFDPEQYLGAGALQSVFDVSTATNFLPQLRQMQARASRMGHRGPIAGALEGDLASAFQRNLLGTVAQYGSERGRMAMDRGRTLATFGGQERAQGLEMMTSRLEREEARRRARRGTIGSFIGATLGGLAGFALPVLGPGVGAQIGARVGAGLGGR